MLQIFCAVSYKAKTTEDLLSGIDEFIDDLTVLPPSIWDASTRLEPPAKTRSVVILFYFKTQRQRSLVGLHP